VGQCEQAKLATLEVVQNVIAKQLVMELDIVHLGTKFVELGASSFNTINYQTVFQMILHALLIIYFTIANFRIQMISFS
jgi:hypothetical protein